MMNRLTFYLHTFAVTLFTFSLFFVVWQSTGLILDIHLGLLVGLSFVLGIEGAAVGYMLSVWLLGLVPYYPWEVFVLAILLFATLIIRRYLPGNTETSALAVTVVATILFYLVTAPGALIGGWPLLVVASVAAGMYAAAIVLYFKAMSVSL